MKLYNVIPITEDLWLEDKPYYYLTTVLHKTVSITHTDDRKLIFNYVEVEGEVLCDWWKVLNSDYRTTCKIIRMPIQDRDEQGFTVLMPSFVFDWLERKMVALRINQRQSISRVFIYLYYYAMRFQGSYSHSRELMLKELKINNHTLCNSIKWLEQNEFIVRSDYSMREDDRYARRYYIPEEFWSNECRKEWKRLQDKTSAATE